MVKRESVGIMNPSPGAQYAVLRSPSKRKGKGRHIRDIQKSICESGVKKENNLLKCRKNISCLQSIYIRFELELKGMNPRENKQSQCS